MSAAEFGDVLKQLRQNAKLSQVELAERLGVDQASVSRWEQGKGEPGVSLVVPLAAALGVDVDVLIRPTIKRSRKRKK